MELTRIEIKNFRSIKAATIQFDHNCLILLGKNEAGKSNVLKAIASIFGKYPLTSKDKRKKIDNERIVEYYVRAIFELNRKDFQEISKRLKTKCGNIESIAFFKNKTIQDYIKNVFREFIVEVEIENGSTQEFSYSYDEESNFEFINKFYLNSNLISTENIGYPIFDLQSEVFNIVITIYSEKLFQCHYWQYSDSFLLPNSVAISSFMSAPSSCKALENIFALCNRENIVQEFNDAMVQDGDYANLLEQISKTVTSTFRKIWKDFKDTSIQLQPNGSEILIKVVNKAKYSFEDRSDGFKKFISILLMLSTQSRSNNICENDIIIIDEPDQSLYPTSAEYLRNELLEISKKSKVIYSTHSQYMIDSTCIDRHVIVEKEDDTTKLKREDKHAPFSNDELLRRAIGSSIFECLKPKNLIFEGWLDKELFNKFCAFEKKQKDFNQYGIVYLGGISGVETLVQLLILANKSFVIIADSDETSKNKKNEFIRNYPEYKESWISYADIIEGVSTMEDFLDTVYISKQIIENGYPEYGYENSKNAIVNIEKAVNKDKDKKQEIKNQLIASVSKENVKPEYGKYIDALKYKIENMI